MCYVATRVCVELIEDRFEAGVCQEVLHVNGCCQEFAVVYHFVLVIIHLADHFVDFFVAYINLCLDQHVVKLLGFNHSRSILVD